VLCKILDLSPDGRLFAAVLKDRQIAVWPGRLFGSKTNMTQFGTNNFSVSFSPDGNWLAAGQGGNGNVELLNLKTGAGNRLPGTGAPVVRMLFLPDGKRLLANYLSSGIQVWNVSGRTVESQFDLGNNVQCIEMSPDGVTLAVGYEDGTVSFREIPTGHEVAQFRPHRRNTSGLAFSPTENILATASDDHDLLLWDLRTGKPLWKTDRADEISTWGTPTLARTSDGREVIVTNGTKVRGYDPATGKQLWTLGPNSEITIGTPVAGNGLVFVTGGYPPVRPIYAIRPEAEGDISLPKGQDKSQAIAWSNMNEGTYIPTPLLYGGYLFTLNINGIVSAYNPDTGQRAFRGRVGTGGSFSASPIAADGRLYVASEDGEIYVITAAPGLAQVAKNDMK
jgi:WD40 repeat protein